MPDNLPPKPNTNMPDTNNTTTTDAPAINIKLVAERAAKSLPPAKPKPKKRVRKGHFPIAWALLATQEQIDSDLRLQVINEFLKASRSKTGRCGPRRDFLINSLYKAIVEAAK